MKTRDSEMRDKLIKLIENAHVWKNGTVSEACEFVADHLLQNGVIVTPNRIVYFIVDKGTKWAFVSSKHTDFLTLHELKDLKKHGYYLTKEEAEKALEGVNG